MRIGIDITGLGPQQRYTGMGEYAHQLVSHLARINTTDTFYLIGYGEDFSLPQQANFHRVTLPGASLGKLRAVFSHQIALPLLARKLRLDVLHIPWVHVRPSHPAVPWRVPCALVVTLHDVIPFAYYRQADPKSLPTRLRLFYALNLRLTARATRVITVSAHSQQDIVRITNIPPERIRVVYNGLDFPPLHLSEEAARARCRALGLPERYLLYAGSYEPRKNLKGTLAGYARAVEDGVDLPLVMIVERASGYAQTLRAYAERLQLGSRLIFIHSLSQEDLRFVYTRATLFLFPSLYEGFGFPPLQAMNCGVPVIAARTSSLPEILGDAALYVDPHQPTEIASAIRKLLTDEAARAHLIAAGKAQAARYTWERAAAETLAVYQEAVTAGHASR